MIKYILASLFVASVVMADTQTKFVGSVSTAAPGTRDWNNPSNMTADDATYSRLAVKIKNGQDTYTINATMSGNEFTLPVDATINGITVTIEFQDVQTGPMGDSVIFIIKGGTASGTDHKDETDDWPTSAGGLITKTWGSTSDLWGLSWTASDINASNFGVSIKGVEVDAVFAQPEIDYIQISVDYSTSTSVALSNATFAFGTEPLNTWLTPESTFVINDAAIAETFVGQIGQLTAGANVWEIDVPSNGADTIRAQWSITSSTGPWTDISAYDTNFTIVTNVAASDSVSFWLRILTPTATTSYNEYSSTLTVIAEIF